MTTQMTNQMGGPMGPQGPMGGAPAQMPNMGGIAPPMGQPPMMGQQPPMGGPPPMMVGPQGPQQPQLSTSIGYGGSAKGRAGFKNSLRNRKQQFQQKQQMGAPMGPPMGQGPQGPIFAQRGGVPMGAMRPPPTQQQGMAPPRQGFAGPGRMIGDNASVGSAPVQMMNGGVVPVFGGLGRY